MFTAHPADYGLEDFCTPEKFESKNVPADLVYFSDAAIGYEGANRKTDAWKIYHNIFEEGDMPTLHQALIISQAQWTPY